MKYLRYFTMLAVILVVEIGSACLYMEHRDNAIYWLITCVASIAGASIITNAKFCFKYPDTGCNPLASELLCRKKPYKLVKSILERGGIEFTNEFPIIENVRSTRREAVFSLSLVANLDSADLANILSYLISSINLYSAYSKKLSSSKEEAESKAEKAAEMQQKVQAAFAQQNKELGARASKIDKLSRKIELMSASRPVQPVAPAPINFDYENANLERRLIKLQSENSMLREKLSKYETVADVQEEDDDDEVLPDLPADGVMYIDGDTRRLQAVGDRYPGWVCLTPANAVKQGHQSVCLIIAHKYRLGHKHTQALKRLMPEVPIYITYRTDFEDDVRRYLANQEVGNVASSV